MSRILLVEDKDSLRRLMTHALGGEGHEVEAVATVAAGRQQLAGSGASVPFDLVLTDLQLPDGTGMDILAAWRQLAEPPPIVVITAHGSVGIAVEAMKLGATDFLEKPVELDDLFALVKRLAGERREPVLFQPPHGAPAIVGRHPALRASLRLLQKVSPTDSTVLLTGESGTGKELFARAVHALSKRASGPFVAVNCAAIPLSLMENELFGHEKGAFTGANRRQAGRFELAEGGTLFLDEIGELEASVQGKVLRVLEERVFERIGGGKPIAADIRIVAATNRDLGAMVEEGEFREDLWYRLDVFPIELPALRERRSDIPDLCLHIAGRIAERLSIEIPELPEAVIARLGEEEWPGNVRQLSNFLERLLILSTDGAVRLEDVETFLGPTPSSASADEESADDEEGRVRDALLATEGDKRAAAERLGMSYRTLQRRIRDFDLEGFPRYR
jgi:DNA-binding NtrC family response regulator